MSRPEAEAAFAAAEVELKCSSRTVCSFKQPPAEIEGVVGGHLRFAEGALFEIGLDFTDADFILMEARGRERRFEGLRQRLLRKYGAPSSERTVRLVPVKKPIFGKTKPGPLARRFAWWRDGDVSISLQLVLSEVGDDSWELPEGESALLSSGIRLFYQNDKIKARRSEKL